MRTRVRGFNIYGAPILQRLVINSRSRHPALDTTHHTSYTLHPRPYNIHPACQPLSLDLARGVLRSPLISSCHPVGSFHEQSTPCLGSFHKRSILSPLTTPQPQPLTPNRMLAASTMPLLQQLSTAIRFCIPTQKSSNPKPDTPKPHCP
jgi:hypothetical protein